MKLEAMNREHVIISGLSSAWVEAHKVNVENYGIVVNQDYMPGTDFVELKYSLMSSLDLLYALEYIAHDCSSDHLWIGKNPMTVDNVQSFFFPCPQDVLISFDDHDFVFQFSIQALVEDAVAFYMELLDSLDRHVWLSKTEFTTSVLGSITIYLEFDYGNDFVDFLSYLVDLDGIYLSVKFDGGDD